MNKIIKSMSYAVIAQTVSLIVSAFMSFYVSKFMSIETFGYYQLFLFYSTYVGIFQFGVSEGTYLEYGGYKFEELPIGKIKQIFINTLTIQIPILFVFVIVSRLIQHDDNKKIVMVFIAMYAIIYFLVMYFGMLLQAINETEKYSKSIIIGKLVTLIFFFGALIIKSYSFITYCVIYLFGYLITAILVTIKCRKIVTKQTNISFILLKNKKLIVSGCSLLFSTLISSLIIGINRIYIDSFMGIEVFGKVSMALSLCNLVVLFAIQVGMVMFPNVVSLDKKYLAQIYRKLNEVTVYLLPLVLILYIPLKVILSKWIPQYTDSISWMLLFMPYMIYEIKNQVIYNTYLKALRKEKNLFLVNIIAFLLCAFINLFVVIIIKKLEVVFCIIDLVIIVKSILLSIVIEREFDVSLRKNMVIEAVLSFSFSLLLYFHINYIVIIAMIISYVAFGLAYKSIIRDLN